MIKGLNAASTNENDKANESQDADKWKSQKASIRGHVGI